MNSTGFSGTLSTGLLCGAIFLGACDSASSDTGSAISGSLLTADGKPIATATVGYEGWPEGATGATDGNGRIVSPASGHVAATDGHYAIKVPPGQYTTWAQAVVKWHDKPFTFKLETADAVDETARAGVTGEKGLTRNYVWKMTGPRPGKDVAYLGSGWEHNVYGASIGMDIYQSDTEHYKRTQPDLRQTNPNDAVEFTLVPDGKLIDGNDGKTITEKVAIEKAGKYGCGIRGIPVGDYTLTARIVHADGTNEPVRVSLETPTYVNHDDSTTKAPWASSVKIVFEPEEGVMADYGTKGVTVYVGK